MASAPEQSPGPGGPLSAGTAARLAAQLQTLAQLGETLTYRLLELEERLAEQQERFAPLLFDGESPEGQDPAGAAAGLALRMGDTEERLGRIEALLDGLQTRAHSPRFQALPGLQARQGLQPASRRLADDEELGEDPFYEEEEQPFMDERSA